MTTDTYAKEKGIDLSCENVKRALLNLLDEDDDGTKEELFAAAEKIGMAYKDNTAPVDGEICDLSDYAVVYAANSYNYGWECHIEVMFNPHIGSFLLCKNMLMHNTETYEKFSLAKYMGLIPSDTRGYAKWLNGLHAIGELSIEAGQD